MFKVINNFKVNLFELVYTVLPFKSKLKSLSKHMLFELDTDCSDDVCL